MRRVAKPLAFQASSRLHVRLAKTLAFQVSSRLRVRLVVFDVNVLQRGPSEPTEPTPKTRSLNPFGVSVGARRPDELVASGQVGKMLLSEIREELIRRGISSIGKRWELEKRLAAELERGSDG